MSDASANPAGSGTAADPGGVSTDDFPNLAVGKVIPYGVDDLAYDGLGVRWRRHGTAVFAVATITAWWDTNRQPHR